jgi:hypothetical protein
LQRLTQNWICAARPWLARELAVTPAPPDKASAVVGAGGHRFAGSKKHCAEAALPLLPSLAQGAALKLKAEPRAGSLPEDKHTVGAWAC